MFPVTGAVVSFKADVDNVPAKILTVALFSRVLPVVSLNVGTLYDVDVTGPKKGEIFHDASPTESDVRMYPLEAPVDIFRDADVDASVSASSTHEYLENLTV